MGVRTFVLSRGKHSFHRRRDGNVCCVCCGGIIKRDEQVVSKNQGSAEGAHRVLYHTECAERVGIT